MDADTLAAITLGGIAVLLIWFSQKVVNHLKAIENLLLEISRKIRPIWKCPTTEFATSFLLQREGKFTRRTSVERSPVERSMTQQCEDGI